MPRNKGDRPADRPKLETAPPVRASCPRCGSTELRFVYSTVFREFGFRRVTSDCQSCHAIVWWDEKINDAQD